jgi:hypothetical protein
MPVLAASAVTHAIDAAGVHSAMWGHQVTPVAAMGRTGEFAVSSTRGSGSSAGGALSSFPRRVARCRPSPWLRSFQPGRRTATCARCRSVLRPTGATRHGHVLARVICARVLARSAYSEGARVSLADMSRCVLSPCNDTSGMVGRREGECCERPRSVPTLGFSPRAVPTALIASVKCHLVNQGRLPRRGPSAR